MNGKTVIAKNLKKTSVRIDGQSGKVISKTDPGQDRFEQIKKQRAQRLGLK